MTYMTNFTLTVFARALALLAGLLLPLETAASATLAITFEIEVSHKISYVEYEEDTSFQGFTIPFAISFNSDVAGDPTSFVQAVHYNSARVGRSLESILPWGPSERTIEPKRSRVALENWGDPQRQESPQFSQFLVDRSDQHFYDAEGNVYPGSFDLESGEYGSDPAFPLLWNYGFMLYSDGPLFQDLYSMSGSSLLDYLTALMQNQVEFQYWEGTRNIDMSTGQSLGGEIYVGHATIVEIATVPEPRSDALVLFSTVFGLLLWKRDSHRGSSKQRSPSGLGR